MTQYNFVDIARLLGTGDCVNNQINPTKLGSSNAGRPDFCGLIISSSRSLFGYGVLSENSNNPQFSYYTLKLSAGDEHLETEWHINQAELCLWRDLK